jgi:hypothetical protein
MDEIKRMDEIGRSAMAAWKRIKTAQSRMWGDWMVVGEGLMEGRRWAMQKAGVNSPEGKAYIIAFGEWLKKYRVDDMDKSDRAKLLQLMEERPAVEEWRASLTDWERRNTNNPVIVWRKWTAATRVKKPRPRAVQVSGAEHGRAQAIIEQQRERIQELEQERDSAKAEPAPPAFDLSGDESITQAAKAFLVLHGEEPSRQFADAIHKLTARKPPTVAAKPLTPKTEPENAAAKKAEREAYFEECITGPGGLAEALGEAFGSRTRVYKTEPGKRPQRISTAKPARRPRGPNKRISDEAKREREENGEGRSSA